MHRFFTHLFAVVGFCLSSIDWVTVTVTPSVASDWLLVAVTVDPSSAAIVFCGVLFGDDFDVSTLDDPLLLSAFFFFRLWCANQSRTWNSVLLRDYYTVRFSEREYPLMTSGVLGTKIKYVMDPSDYALYCVTFREISLTERKANGEHTFPISPGHSFNAHIDGKSWLSEIICVHRFIHVKRQNIVFLKAGPILKCVNCSFYVFLEYCKNI